MRQHALDGEVRLAGVRRTKNGPDTGVVAGGQWLPSRCDADQAIRLRRNCART
jgi:hypothetical protein